MILAWASPFKVNLVLQVMFYYLLFTIDKIIFLNYIISIGTKTT